MSVEWARSHQAHSVLVATPLICNKVVKEHGLDLRLVGRWGLLLLRAVNAPLLPCTRMRLSPLQVGPKRFCETLLAGRLLLWWRRLYQVVHRTSASEPP
jgi:hypothetical protein